MSEPPTFNVFDLMHADREAGDPMLSTDGRQWSRVVFGRSGVICAWDAENVFHVYGDTEEIADAVFRSRRDSGDVVDGRTFPRPPHGWHTFGEHANYREDFGEECPPLVFSEETDEAGMPLWERIDVVAIRRGVAQRIAEETLPLLADAHVGCVSRAQDSLRRYLPKPIYGED
jgi:hypothetical protein